jgi:DNA primase
VSAWVSFAEIKSGVRLRQVLQFYGVDWLRRSGVEQYRGRCPIHQGQGTEAFHANLVRDVFHCFACGAGGNVLDFVSAMESCTIGEAAIRLQESGGGRGAMPVASRGSARRKLVTKKREVNTPLGFALDLDRAHPYLAQRGIDAITAGHFEVGYCDRGLMRGRIAIPIHDDQGRLVAYGGRAVEAFAPRYRFPAGFQKSQVLFNYHRARAAGAQTVIVVEGFFDCMRVHQAGFAGVVALMGSRLSAVQKDLLANRFSAVVLLLDGDHAGRAATAQIAHDLEPACSVKTVLLPPEVQPDQMTAHHIQRAIAGAERRQEIIAN